MMVIGAYVFSSPLHAVDVIDEVVLLQAADDAFDDVVSTCDELLTDV